MNFQLRAQAAPWNRGVELLILAGQPSLELTMQAAQTLMDDLWQAGLRPTEEPVLRAVWPRLNAT